MADDIRRWTKYDIDAEVESDGAVFVSAADHDREVARLTRERDLAIAHDTQPYPTAHAYERVCEVLAERDREVARLRAERDRAIETRENANRVSARAQLENERLRVAGNQLALAAADAIIHRIDGARNALAAADREAPERCASCGGPDGHLGACTTWTPPVSDEQEVPDA